MKYCRYLLYGLLALLVGGCGQTVQQSLKVQPAQKSTAGADKSVVILPFADYSYADDLETAFRRNMYIGENLTDQFVSNSFHVPVQEDVFGYLISQNIISIMAYEDRKTSNLEEALRDEWSAPMKDQLQRYITLANTRSSSNKPVLDSPGSHSLTQQEVVKIGRHFGADYIVRGRIIEYKTRQDPSWNPMKRGILTFVTGSTAKLFFGNASSDTYDMYANMITGAAIGGIIGSGVTWPWDPAGGSTIFGIDGGRTANTILWGGVGGAFGKLAHKSGVAPQAVVQLRIWVQDAYSGDVVWTNRVDVKVSPDTVYGDIQYDALFESATEKAISTLIDDFVSQAM